MKIKIRRDKFEEIAEVARQARRAKTKSQREFLEGQISAIIKDSRIAARVEDGKLRFELEGRDVEVVPYG